MTSVSVLATIKKGSAIGTLMAANEKLSLQLKSKSMGINKRPFI
jgi:hypothetical protein